MSTSRSSLLGEPGVELLRCHRMYLGPTPYEIDPSTMTKYGYKSYMETSSGSPRAVGNIHGEFFFNDLIQMVALIHLQTRSIMNLVVGEGVVVI